jgi:nucleoside-diphosphate-sugar epimerase
LKTLEAFLSTLELYDNVDIEIKRVEVSTIDPHTTDWPFNDTIVVSSSGNDATMATLGLDKRVDPMKILVTGYKGFIGRNMTVFLEKENIEWVGYEWGETKYSLKSIDRVIHLGAISDTTYDNIRQLLLQNYYFTETLVNECNRAGIPIQIASSASVYGIDNTTFKESDFPAPRNHYAWSKYLVEEYCNTHHFDIPVQVFRYFNVHGPMEGHKGDQASPHHKFRTQAIEKGTIKLFEGSEHFKRDFIHVDTICNLHKRFFNVDISGTWNFGTGVATSFKTVADSIALEYNSVIEFIPMPEKLKSSYQAFTKADMSLTYDTLKEYEA